LVAGCKEDSLLGILIDLIVDKHELVQVLLNREGVLDLGLYQNTDECRDEVVCRSSLQFVREAERVCLANSNHCLVESDLLLLWRLEPLYLMKLFDTDLPHAPVDCMLCFWKVEIVWRYPIHLLNLCVVFHVVRVLDSVSMPDSLMQPSHDVVAHSLDVVVGLRLAKGRHLILEVVLEFVVKVFEQVLVTAEVRFM